MSAITPAMVAAVEHYLSRCETTEGGCLAVPGLDYYGEIRWETTRMAAHRAVLAVHLGLFPDRDTVTRHACDNPPCVNVDHLSFGTQAQNLHDCYGRARRRTGWKKGEERPCAILTADDVRDLRRRAAAGEPLGSLAASVVGVSYSSVRCAVRGETWTHITDVPPVPGRTNKVGNLRAYRLTRADDAKRVLELVNAGLTLQQVADRIGVTRHTAWRLLGVAREVAA